MPLYSFLSYFRPKRILIYAVGFYEMFKKKRQGEKPLFYYYY
uniref:Uncharacterized protein n=1 Tax=Rhizophora mucronata TaxID=61149 RepID=A0A2P2NXZ3_RHIMU